MKKRRIDELSSRIIADSVRDKQFKSKEELSEFIGKITEETRNEGTLLGWLPKTPGNQAFELIFQAWNESAKEKRAGLAMQALDIDPTCIDGYILLAENAESLEEQHTLYYKAVALGESVFGPEFFQDYRGKFWQIVSTRPYMRAKAALAETLLALGQEAQAVENYKDLLRLNPCDNQGVRYRLFDLLLGMAKEKHVLTRMFEHFRHDTSAHYLYQRVLWLFLRGTTTEANAALRNAAVRNPFVPIYLLNCLPLPQSAPDLMALGSPEEAVSFVHLYGKRWELIKGARAWLTKKSATPTEAILEMARQLVDPQQEPAISLDLSIALPVSVSR
jgi:tetratricopeptide (TPR) repeat protein